MKNEGNILPLKKDQKISLVGNLADMKEEIIGAWAMSWQHKDCVTILDGLKVPESMFLTILAEDLREI